jgi:epoxyqueuosine reductase QueG
MSVALKRQVKRMCAGMAIPLVGFAPVERWDVPLFEPWVPPPFRPTAIFSEARTVLVIGIPVHLPVLETAPSIFYHELYRTVNTLLDTHAYRIASYLNTRGFPSLAIPRDGYGSIDILVQNPIAFFSHRHAAFCAGLGNFGVNNMLLTPAYGPRVRFTSIFTAAEISPDPVMKKPLCIRCMRCVRACPVNALSEGEYPESLTGKKACATRSLALNQRYCSPCGICIKVCPVGTDRKHYGREDMGIYNEEDTDFDWHHRAWKHVRSYGIRQETGTGPGT